MKHISQSVKVGVLLIMTLTGFYVLWKTTWSRSQDVEHVAEYHAYLRDAVGLPVGSRVVIAGLAVGQVHDLTVHNGKARVTIHIQEDIPVYSNAILRKKSASLLGDYYLEVSPGNPETIDATGQVIQHALIASKGEITHVVEIMSADDLIRKISNSLPNVDSMLSSIERLSDNLNNIATNSVDSSIAQIDSFLKDEIKVMSDILRNTDSVLSEVRTILINEKQAQKVVDNIESITDTTKKIADKINDNEGQGTLGRLINDSVLADNLEEIADGAKTFVKSVAGMQTFVGLRSEYNVFSQTFTNYMSVSLHPRPNKYYIFELGWDGRGYAETTLVYDPILNPATDGYAKRTIIRDIPRVTLQFAKRIDWATFRFGVKESYGGLGIDTHFLNDKVKFSVDLFEGVFNKKPRLKLAAAVEFFSHLYVLAGVNDALNEEHILQSEDTNVTDPQIPGTFDEIRLGRDYFVGGMVYFNDLDLAAMLSVGSGLLSVAL